MLQKNKQLITIPLFFLLLTSPILSFSQQAIDFQVKEDLSGRWEYEIKMLENPKTGKIPDGIFEKEILYIYSTKAALQPSLQTNNRISRTSDWDRRGPYNLGGRTRALAIDITNEDIFLAGGVSGGMWRTVDAGITWVKTTAPEQLHSVSCVIQDKRTGQTNTWYYGTGELNGNSARGGNAPYRGNGVFKSTDGGVSWTQLSATVTDEPQTFNNDFQYVWNMIINPVNGDVYAATIGGIYQSKDGGDSWLEVLDSGNDGFWSDIAVTSTGVFYATLSGIGMPSNQGVFRSIDGEVWVDITPTELPTVFERITLDIAPSNESLVYFYASTPSSGIGEEKHSLLKYEYLSGDGSAGGGSWTDLTSNLPSFGGIVGDLNQANYNQFVRVKPDDENVVFIGSTNLYRSTDGFSTDNNTDWVGGYATANNVSLYPNHHADNHALAFFPSDAEKMLSAHDGGVSITTNNLGVEDGGTFGGNILPIAWESLNNGYFTTQPYAISIDPNTANNNELIAGFQDNGSWSTTSTSENVVWEEEFGADGGYSAIVSGSNIKYVSSQSGNVFRFGVRNTSIDPDDATGQLFINPFILDKNDQGIMYYPAGQFMWRNNNVDANDPQPEWEKLSGTEVTETITALDISKSSANVLYYGTNNGEVYKLANAQAANPIKEDISSADFPTDGYVSCIAVDNNDADKIFVIFSNYSVKSIWYSIDGGSSWTDVSGNLEENPDGTGSGPSVRWLTIANSSTYYVGTSTGLYSTSQLDGSFTSWTQEGSTSIGNVVVPMVIARDIDETVFVATHGNGIYSTGTIAITALEDLNPLLDFNNLKVFPNPSLGQIQIQLKNTLAKKGKVEVYDIEGQLVAEKLLLPYNNKELSIELDLTYLQTGVYTIKVITGDFLESQKILIQR